MASCQILGCKNCKEHPNRSTNNGDMAELAKRPVNDRDEMGL